MRVVFMGTPEFAVPSLQALIDHHQVAGVVTQPDRQRGRGKKVQFSPVKEKAVAYDIPVLQPERARDEAFIEELAKLDPEVIVVVAYGQILPEASMYMDLFCRNTEAQRQFSGPFSTEKRRQESRPCIWEKDWIREI